MKINMQIEPATAAVDDILIDHYMAIWESYGTPSEHYADDARDRVSDFIEQCRKHAHHGAFIATIDGEVAGSVVCCLLRSPYPDVIEPEHRMRGYISSVFTTPGHRRKGVGKQLTARGETPEGRGVHPGRAPCIRRWRERLRGPRLRPRGRDAAGSQRLADRELEHMTVWGTTTQSYIRGFCLGRARST